MMSWSTLETLLRVAEVILFPASLIFLAVALSSRGRLLWPALALALVVGLTLNFPWGLVATPMGEQQFYAHAHPEKGDSKSARHFKVAGLPASFVPYSRPAGGSEFSSPTGQLRVRYWLGPGLATGRTAITDLCRVTFEPCWFGNDRSYPGNTSRLEVWKSDDSHYRLRVHNGDDQAPGAKFNGWELRYGWLGSISHTIFWSLFLLLLGLGLLPRPSADLGRG
jgi:hypothetical protein